MTTTTHRSFWVSLRHIALLVVLVGVGFAVLTFTSDSYRMFESQASALGMHLSTWGKSDEGRVPTPSEQRRLKMMEAGRVIAGGCVLGFITVGVIRVIKSWRKSLA
jgi:hypothetical protein